VSTSYGPVAVWGVLVVVGVATYAIRLSFLHLFGRVDEVPPRVRAALTYVPAAVFAAIVVPDVVSFDAGAAGAGLGTGAGPGAALLALVSNERTLAAVVAGVVAYRTRNVALTVAAGMGALWLLRFVVFG
jgi:branched-subunit amino acid transport protein